MQASRGESKDGYEGKLSGKLMQKDFTVDDKYL